MAWKKKNTTKVVVYPLGLLSNLAGLLIVKGEIDLASLSFLLPQWKGITLLLTSIFHSVAPLQLDNNKIHLIKARTGQDGPRSVASRL